MIEINENLIRDLYKKMEKELEKNLKEMNTYKIREINCLIARLEGREELPPDMDPEQFLIRFNEKFGLDLQPMPVEAKQPSAERKKAGQASWKVWFAMVVVIIVVLVGIGNTASVMAVDKSLWQIIKETTHGVYYRTLDAGENLMEESVSESYEKYSDWEALKQSVERNILFPKYIPDGLELKVIEKNIFENCEKIMAHYQGEDIQLTILCEYYTIKGDFFKNKGGNETLNERREIGERNVSISIDEDIHIIFAEDDAIYIIDTNLALEEAEKVVENME